MKYSCTVMIDRPIAEVIDKFDSTENLHNWQPTLKATEHLSGEPGQPGAKMKLTYDQRGRDMFMVETINDRSFPTSFSATYEAPGVVNPCVNRFEDLGNQTRWTMDTEFRFSGFMAIISLFMRGAFPRETQKMMDQFKSWVEST